MAFAYDIDRLARRQAELGWTDLKLATVAGVHPSTVKNVMTERTCRPSTVRSLAEALGFPLADIVVRATGREAVA